MSEQQKVQFIYVFDPVRRELVTDPDAWTEEETRIAHSHFSYLSRATEEGIVVLAGRSTDGEGPAVVVFDAPTETEARQFMENDPFVAGGLMRASLHPFRAALVQRP